MGCRKPYPDCRPGRRSAASVFGEDRSPGIPRGRRNLLVRGLQSLAGQGDALALDPYALYQVTVDMTAEKTRRRELGSLEAAMLKTGIANGTVITLREEGSVQVAGGQVAIIPAWKWALLGM